MRTAEHEVPGAGHPAPVAPPSVGTGPFGRVLAPFAVPAYRRMALALVCGTFAFGVWTVALVWEVIGIGGGPAALSVVSTAGGVGVLLPALVAGVVADRVPQKLVVVAVALGEVVSYAVVATLSLLGVTTLWELAVAAFALGTGMAFYYAAYNAWLPAVVPEGHLQAVNGFEGMVRPLVAQAAGPAVGGAVVGAASPGAACVLAAVLGGTGLLIQWGTPTTPLRRTTAAAAGVRGAWADVVEGLAYLRRTPWLLWSLLFASVMVMMVMGPLDVLVPFLVKDRLGGGSGDHALVLAAFGVGGGLGSLAVASLPMPRRYLTAMMLTWGFGCLPLAAMGLARSLTMLVLAAFVLGACFSAPMVVWGTVLQRRVPAHLLGRVASLDFLVSISLMPLSMALAGQVGAIVGLTTVFVTAGVVPAVAGVVAVLVARMPRDEVAHPLR